MKTLISTLFTLLCIFFIAQSYGQDIRSIRSGFTLSISGKYVNWKSNSQFVGSLDSEEPNGIGFTAEAAYGVTEQIQIIGSFSQAYFTSQPYWDTYTNTHLQLGARYNFGGTLSSVRPFVEAAVASNSFTITPITFNFGSFTETHDLDMSGLGIHLGAGASFFVTSRLSIQAKFVTHFGDYSTTELTNEQFEPFDDKVDFRFLGGEIGLGYNF